MAKPKTRTDDEYVKLDEAIATMFDWRKEITQQLIDNRVNGPEKVLWAVMEAMRQVHSPEEQNEATKSQP